VSLLVYIYNVWFLGFPVFKTPPSWDYRASVARYLHVFEKNPEMHPKEPWSSASSDLILLVIFFVYSTQFSVSVSKILANKQLKKGGSRYTCHVESWEHLHIFLLNFVHILHLWFAGPVYFWSFTPRGLEFFALCLCAWKPVFKYS
jgi:hypothetical protein